MDQEARRSARIASGFWVAVEGVDAELVLRRGDVSATGIFFEIEHDIGDVGTVQWLHIASLDKTRVVHVMAHIVRIAALSDLLHRVKGVALEFMPESDDVAASLVDFAQHVLEKPRRDGTPARLAPRLPARAEVAPGAKPLAPSSETTLKELSVQTLVLETDWSVPVGEPLRVEIVARGVRRPIRVEGQAVSVLPANEGAASAKRFRIAVRVKEEIKGPLRRFSSMELRAIDPKAQRTPPKNLANEQAAPATESPLEQLLSTLIVPPEEPRERKHLEGELARIPFTALCSLLELERLGGELTIRRGGDLITLYVANGRFVDIEGPGAAEAPRELIKSFLHTREGTFAFIVTSVERPDRIGMSMTEILLEAARESDEAARPASETPSGDDFI